MTAHDHRTIVPGCHRCETSSDEAAPATPDVDTDLIEVVGFTMEDAAWRWVEKDLRGPYRDRIAAEILAAIEPALRAKIAGEIEAAVDLGTCECGHWLGEHNRLGCFARDYPEPGVTVACCCPLTDDRHPEALAQVAAARIARGVHDG